MGVTALSALIVKILNDHMVCTMIVEIKEVTTLSALIVEIMGVTTYSALKVEIFNDHMKCTRCLSFKIRDFSFIITLR